jgi:hypothetical protein
MLDHREQAYTGDAHEKFLQLGRASSGSYLVVASQLIDKEDDSSSSSSSSGRHDSALTSIHERTIVSVIKEGKLGETGLGAIRRHLADDEHNIILLRYKNDCVSIQCVDENIG